MRLPALYAIVDPLDTGRDPAALAAALLRGGARVVQLRWPEASARELLAAALAIRPLARAAGALFLVNDRPDVARAAEADGVHLGQDDLPVAAARRVLGAGGRIGVSTHDLEQARAAEAAGADYIAVGPVYATTTKPDALAPRGLALVSAVRAAVRCPLVAIRSEEHTSELQSPCNLVCRLLLEKKKASHSFLLASRLRGSPVPVNR